MNQRKSGMLAGLALAIVGSSVGAVIGTSLGWCEREPARAPTIAVQPAPPRHFGASSGGAVVRWLDVSTPQQAGVLLAIARHLDGAFGYPIAATNPDGTPAGAAYATLHHTMPLPHPTQPGRWRVPLDARAALEWATLKAACVVRVDAGATGPCVAIAAMPALVTTPDSSWDGADAGLQPVNPAAPNDDYDGGTP